MVVSNFYIKKDLLKSCRIIVNKRWRKIALCIKVLMLLITIAPNTNWEKNTFVVIICKDLGSVKIVEKHKKVCKEINGKKTVGMPKKNSAFEFKDFNRHIKTPFEIYVYNSKMHNWNEPYTDNYCL